jgi:hypothetical protein
MEQLYKISQFFTTGWEVTDSKLPKEECDARLARYVQEGVKPSHLKASTDNESDS